MSSPLPPELAAANLRALADAWEASGDENYPHEFLEQHKLSGQSYQTMYNTLTGRPDYGNGTPGELNNWCDFIDMSTLERALTWDFLACAIETGDL